jgi:phosphoribosyl 1,2-cyclic phosphate phosphodiesterase
MHLTLLGTGNAAGMPLYGCDCECCTLARDQRQWRRTACSALLKVGTQQYLLDGGQVNLSERFPAGSLNGLFLTHFHPDHVQGLFHFRWGTGLKIPVFTPPDSQGCADLYKYSGILEFLPQQAFNPLSLGDLTITPLPLIHSKPTFGYVFECGRESIAYLTDTKGLPEATEAWLVKRSLDLLVIDSSFVPGSTRKGHNNLDDVLQIDEQLRPQRLVLTHIDHDMDIWLKKHQSQLPSHVFVGHDGMVAFPYAITAE